MTFNELLALDKTPLQVATTPRPATSRKTRKDGAHHRASNHDPVEETKAAATQETRRSGHRETEAPRYHATMTPTMLKALRQAVRRIGKEAGTYRFTREEKDQLTETIYTQGRAGIKTCENEIVSIGLNWLMEEHRARGEKSVLARALQALRA